MNDGPVDILEEGSDLNMASAYEQALSVVDKKHVKFNFNRLGTFTVTGSTVTRDMKIFPNPSCSCPETKICYHVMAVGLAFGLGNTSSKKCPNLPGLRKNAKQKELTKLQGGRDLGQLISMGRILFGMIFTETDADRMDMTLPTMPISHQTQRHK